MGQSIRLLILAFIFILFNIYLFITSASINQELMQTESRSIDVYINEELSKKCEVYDYNFSREDFDTIYKYKNYPPCKAFNNYIIDTSYGNTTVKCTTNDSLYFSDIFNQAYGGQHKLPLKWTSNNSINPKSEFQFVKCSSNGIHANVFQRFNKISSEKANKIRKNLKGKPKNMNVLLLLLDSVSKKSFQANLPKTYEFLKKLEKNEFLFYEFEKSIVSGTTTRPNMAQILYGKNIESLEKDDVKNGKKVVVFKGRHKNQDHAIWTYYRKMGYVTMFLHDTIWDFLAYFSGRVIDSDHVFTNIWKYLWAVTKINDSSERQRCIGSRNFHELSLEYTYQYFSNYKNNNKFAYVHLNAGHEQTGNIRTLDNDLMIFLSNFLNQINSKNESLALFILSDHGFKHTTKLQFDMRSFLDPRAPMTSVVLTRDIVNEWKIGKSISFNQKKLNSRYDINLSLKEIAYFPYERLEDLNILKNYKEYQAFSLFSEFIPENRTCRDVNVSDNQCICKTFINVDIKIEIEMIIKGHFIDLIKKFFMIHSKENLNCRAFEYFEIISFKKFLLGRESLGVDTFYSLEIKHFEKSFKANANFGNGLKVKKNNKILDENMFPLVFFKFQDFHGFLQISGVEISEECLGNFCGC